MSTVYTCLVNCYAVLKCQVQLLTSNLFFEGLHPLPAWIDSIVLSINHDMKWYDVIWQWPDCCTQNQCCHIPRVTHTHTQTHCTYATRMFIFTLLHTPCHVMSHLHTCLRMHTRLLCNAQLRSCTAQLHYQQHVACTWCTCLMFPRSSIPKLFFFPAKRKTWSSKQCICECLCVPTLAYASKRAEYGSGYNLTTCSLRLCYFL